MECKQNEKEGKQFCNTKSEASKEAYWDWVDSSDQADPLGGPIIREAEWLGPAQRNLGRPSRPRPD